MHEVCADESGRINLGITMMKGLEHGVIELNESDQTLNGRCHETLDHEVAQFTWNAIAVGKFVEGYAVDIWVQG